MSADEPLRANGRVDVLATKNGERIGIEIETEKSDVVANVKNCILSKFGELLVVAMDEIAMEKTVGRLAQAGLLIPNQVELVLPDEYGPSKEREHEPVMESGGMRGAWPGRVVPA